MIHKKCYFRTELFFFPAFFLVRSVDLGSGCTIQRWFSKGELRICSIVEYFPPANKHKHLKLLGRTTILCFWDAIVSGDTVDGRHPAPVEGEVISICKILYIPGSAGFFAINSMLGMREGIIYQDLGSIFESSPVGIHHFDGVFWEGGHIPKVKTSQRYQSQYHRQPMMGLNRLHLL